MNNPSNVSSRTLLKYQVYKKMVKPTAKFGNEMWAVTKLDVTRLGTGEREILRICGSAVEQGM